MLSFKCSIVEGEKAAARLLRCAPYGGIIAAPRFGRRINAGRQHASSLSVCQCGREVYKYEGRNERLMMWRDDSVCRRI